MPGTPVHQVLGEGATSHGKGRRRLGRSAEKCSETCFGEPAPGGSHQGFLSGSFSDATLLPNRGAGEGDGGDFDSPRGGEETWGSQSTDLGRHVENCERAGSMVL